MKRLIQKFREIWSIEELRQRILFTLALLSVYRLGSHIVLPGVDGAALHRQMEAGGGAQGLLGLVNTFTGGSFNNLSIFALGIMPYISASIVVQLLTFAVPTFQKMQREGESGQRKINQITRMLTVVITIMQSFAYLGYITSAHGAAIAYSGPLFNFGNALIITSGTIFCMYLGERITDKGIGNGVSLIIAIGIVARLPDAIFGELDARMQGGGGFIIFALELACLLLVTIGTIALIQAVRKIPLNFAMAASARSSRFAAGGGARDYLPIKLNQAGVMPIIFAQALMFIPATLYQYATDDQASGFVRALNDYKSPTYNIIYFLMIIIFTYVYTALVMNPQLQAENLKRSNAFIPGVKPGRDTSDFIDVIVTRITLPGAIALGFIAILPSFAGSMGVKDAFAYFYGGTSLIIMVGVVLDTLQQIENYLLIRHYDGLIKGGRLQGRGAFSQ